MAYKPPSIGVAGLSIPSYNDIYGYYIENYQSIFGQQVSLDNSNADIQMIAILALALSDALNALQLDYNNRSPNFAVGTSLDSLVKLNGLSRKTATFSTCLVTLTGTPGTVINNGIVEDVNGNEWNLPTSGGGGPPVTIGSGGTVQVLATAQVAGAINVAANQITIIVTPVAGWTSVTNGSNLPTVGEPVELDSQLRARQAQSTELPSITLIAGTVAGIEAVPGVTRLNVDENYTGSTNGNGTPAHSIQAVVEGGADLAVATAIYNNKSIGCGTFGSDTQTVVDPVTGVSNSISFDRPSYVPIYVILGVHALTGYTTATTTAIKTAVTNYLNSLQIGERVSFSAIFAIAQNVSPNLSAPLFAIEVASSAIGTTPSPTGTTDIVLSFNQVSQGVLANVTVNLV